MLIEADVELVLISILNLIRTNYSGLVASKAYFVAKSNGVHLLNCKFNRAGRVLFISCPTEMGSTIQSIILPNILLATTFNSIILLISPRQSWIICD